MTADNFTCCSAPTPPVVTGERGEEVEPNALWVPCMVCDAPVGEQCRYVIDVGKEPPGARIRPLPHDSRVSDLADVVAAFRPLVAQARADGVAEERERAAKLIEWRLTPQGFGSYSSPDAADGARIAYRDSLRFVRNLP